MLESEIKREVCDYLKARGIWHWVQQAGKIPGRTATIRGVSDLLGIFEGRMLAIEVKTPKGKVSPEQEEFLRLVNKFGGIGFVAKSVDDVELKLAVASEINRIKLSYDKCESNNPRQLVNELGGKECG